MAELAVLTPSYRPDLPLFIDLHASVLAHTPPGTVHHVVVPAADRDLFSRFGGARCRIWTVPELLPSRIRPLPRALPRALWLNLARPWPPVRGWVLQQAIKIAATVRLDARVVLLADSDVAFVRPVTADTFRDSGTLRITRTPGAIDDTAGLERHVRWHAVARDLLGLPPAGPPYADYVNPLNFWDPEVVRAMQRRVTEVTGRDWLDVFCSRLHVSEFILYGVFVDELWAPGAATASAGPVSHNYWEHDALDEAGAEAFAERLGPDAVAVMISARSATTLHTRRAVLRRCAQ
ncbi:DUF6492 family protein, partial [Actinocorallia lasiicapitis]